jgi:hypothetical protein
MPNHVLLDRAGGVLTLTLNPPREEELADGRDPRAAVHILHALR